MSVLTSQKLNTMEQQILGEGNHAWVTLADLDGLAIVIKTSKGLNAVFDVEVDILRHLCGVGGAPVVLADFAAPRRIVTTFAGRQTLFQKMKERPPGPLVLRFALGVAERLREIHALNVVHNDIKTDNIMVSLQNRDGSGSPEVRLIDFGIACMAGESKNYKVPDKFVHLAPEVRRSGASTPASDVYSLGVLFHDIARPTKDEQVQHILISIGEKATVDESDQRIPLDSIIKLLRFYVSRIDSYEKFEEQAGGLNSTKATRGQEAQEYKPKSFQG